MCLKTLRKIPKNQEGIFYKIYDINNIGIISSPFRHHVIELGQTYKAIKSEIPLYYGRATGKYITGFSGYPRLQEAKIALASFTLKDNNKRVLIKCKYKGVNSKGLDGSGLEVYWNIRHGDELIVINANEITPLEIVDEH